MTEMATILHNNIKIDVGLHKKSCIYESCIHSIANQQKQIQTIHHFTKMADTQELLKNDITQKKG